MRLDKTVPGQRWVSDSEPELGLGLILKRQGDRVELFFPAAGELRQYAVRSAPLRRVRFEAGDRIQTHGGDELFVDSVTESGGLIVYRAQGRDVPEADLADTISFSKVEDRLFTGQVDDQRTFDLRVQTLRHQNRIRKSPVRGFVGGRVDLLEHQIYIAGEVAGRLAPRVLLADEVGLGKTIEAGLIMHRLHLTGRAARILILVPEPLVHQWFVEMLRRFNLSFSIFDEDRCRAIEGNDTSSNPFLDSQLVLGAIEFASSDPKRVKQILGAGWDLLVVDEAHHLEWEPGKASARYELVESLAQKTAGLLLLTATPQQLGPDGHFARLRLLDADRYTDLEKYREEAEDYVEVAAAVNRLLGGGQLEARDAEMFGKRSARVKKHCQALAGGDESAREMLVAELLDEFGTGRVMFRNTRAALPGFPERVASLIPLEATAGKDDFAPRVKWLAGCLKTLGEQKVLLICRTRALAERIAERVQSKIKVKLALFHEDLTLMQRDRNAAFFAEEDGARLLICSEIGSEGRNFQFAHHLVLFDLPEDPELLEQRIGRLDRIGQTEKIRIHVPYVVGTEGEVLARWFHEGLNAFEESLHGAVLIVRSLKKQLTTVLAQPEPEALEHLIEHSVQRRSAVMRKMERGHDRLLELNSSKPERARELIREIRAMDEDHDFEEYILEVLDHFGVKVEDLGNRRFLLQPGELMTDALPALPDEGLTVHFARNRALIREDVSFMSCDHPLVRGAMDLLLGSQSGNASFGVWECPGEKERIFLEVYALIECVAPASLHVDRFLPATPVRVVVDQELEDRSSNAALREARLLQGDFQGLLGRKGMKQKLLPAMLEKGRRLAAAKQKEIVVGAAREMDHFLEEEIDRLVDLGEINDHVGPGEIEALRQQKAELRVAIDKAHLRVDAVRLIWRHS